MVAPPKTDYETARIGEIQSRKTLYGLRIKRLQGQLLDRAEVAREFGSMVSAIKAVMQQSEMPRSIKQDLFAQLLSFADFHRDCDEKPNAGRVGGRFKPGAKLGNRSGDLKGGLLVLLNVMPHDHKAVLEALR